MNNRFLALVGRSRSDSVTYIKQASTKHQVVRIIQPNEHGEYAWNFHPIFRGGGIEFRRPLEASTQLVALGWATLTGAFILASMQYGSSSTLDSFPSNIGGLRSLMSQVQVPGLDICAHYMMAWRKDGTNSDQRACIPYNDFVELFRFGDAPDAPNHYQSQDLTELQALVMLRDVVQEDAEWCGATIQQAIQNRWATLDDELHSELGWDMHARCPQM